MKQYLRRQNTSLLDGTVDTVKQDFEDNANYEQLYKDNLEGLFDDHLDILTDLANRLIISGTPENSKAATYTRKVNQFDKDIEAMYRKYCEKASEENPDIVINSFYDNVPELRKRNRFVNTSKRRLY